MSKRLLTLLVLWLGTVGFILAQDKPVYFTGMGRAIVTNDHLDRSSAVLKNDTTSERRDLNGSFVFDLGVNVQASESLRASAILRVSNQFGGFFSTGSALEFRQVQIKGVLAGKVKYQIGDIDLGLTKYTLFNSEEVFHDFESDLFSLRRNIISYENFNNGNMWRLQGAQAGTTLLFNQYIQSITFNAFGNRIKQSDYISSPDRLLTGGSVKVKQSEHLEFGGNTVYVSDVPGTVVDTLVQYSNFVYTGDYKFKYDLNAIKLEAFGELGASSYRNKRFSDTTEVANSDFFYDLGLAAGLKDKPVKLSVSYRYVGPRFYSPGAQTMRVFAAGTPGVFPTGQNGLVTREQTLFDRYSDQRLYNASISPLLMEFLPQFGNVTPYGQATPNRQGISTELTAGSRNSLLYASVNAELLQEAIGVGVEQKRSFTAIQGGLTLNANRLIEYKKTIALTFGTRYEQTTRGGLASVDLNSLLVDAGVNVEVLKSLDVLLGYKYLTAKGNEYLGQRDGFNEVVSYNLYNVDSNFGVYAFGLRYKFSNHNYLAVNAHMSDYNNSRDNTRNYQINQWFFNYIIKF